MSRRKPYTAAGVRRLLCYRCSRKARHQWSICADGNVWRPICEKCDVALNGVVLRFMRVPDGKAKLAKYKARASE